MLGEAMNLDFSVLILQGLFFLVLAVILSFLFVLILRQISHLCSRLCIYHKKEKLPDRIGKLFFVNLKLSSAFFLVIFSIFVTIPNISIPKLFAIVAGVSFVVLSSSRIMAITKWSHPNEMEKTEKERIASNLYSIITAAFIVALSIIAFNLIKQPTIFLTFQPEPAIEQIEIILLILFFIGNALAMTIFQSSFCHFLKIPKELQQ